ncbi:hypothetical protein ACTXT7_008236 [Hymenolepis weldensis]
MGSKIAAAFIGVGGTMFIAHYRFKLSISLLVRKSLDILTIVVPPALPAVMTTGLYLAQTRLKKLEIFCINPSAINVAGTLNTVVFDKTGTLTEETISVKGVCRCGFICDKFDLTKVEDISNDPGPLIASLAACHSLSLDPVSLEVVGDPLDRIFRDNDLKQFDRNFKHTLQAIVYNSTLNDGSPWSSLGVVRHFPFSSEAQRQSVVVETSGNGEVALLCKGAPEAIAAHCDAQTLPSDFEKMLQHFTEQGCRVLALAWKPIEVDKKGNKMHVLSKKREELECNLRFLGLAILDNPLKPETSPTVRELLDADFHQRESFMKQKGNIQIMLYQQQENLQLVEQFTKHRNPTLCPDILILQISQFHHDPEADPTFNNRLDKYKSVFRKDLADTTEEERVRLLFRRSGTVEHKNLKSYI